MAHWIVVRHGKEHGPLSSQQLKQLATTGRLRPDDLVRRQDATTLHRAGDVKGLFAPPVTSAPGPTPPPLPSQQDNGPPSLPNAADARGALVSKLLVIAGTVVLCWIVISAVLSPSKDPGSGQAKAAQNDLAPNEVALELLSKLEKPVSSMDAGRYKTILDAIAAHEAEQLAHSIIGIDPYALFSADELAAMQQPIGGTRIAPESGTFEDQHGNSQQIPGPLMFWSQVSDIENDVILVGSFYVRAAADEGGARSEEYKTVWFERVTDFKGGESYVKKVGIDRIVFQGLDGIETTVNVSLGSISSVACQGQTEHLRDMVPKQRRVFDSAANDYKYEEYLDNVSFSKSGDKIFRILFGEEGEFKIERGDWR